MLGDEGLRTEPGRRGLRAIRKGAIRKGMNEGARFKFRAQFRGEATGQDLSRARERAIRKGRLGKGEDEGAMDSGLPLMPSTTGMCQGGFLSGASTFRPMGTGAPMGEGGGGGGPGGGARNQKKNF